MFKIISIVLTGSVLLGFYSGAEKTSQEITRVRISLTMPLGIDHGKLVNDTMTVYASEYKNYLIFELPAHEMALEDNKPIYDLARFDYFVFNKEKKYGYLLKNINDSFVTKINRDSILKLRGFNGGKGDKGLCEIFVKPANIVLLSENKYISRYIFQNDPYDSAYLFFDKSLNNVSFSISRAQDSLSRSKLYRVQLFLKPDKAYISNLRQDEALIYQYEIVPAPDSTGAVKKLFDRFLKEERGLK